MVSKGNHSPIIAYMNVAHPNNHRRSTDYSHSHSSIMSGDYLHEYLLLPLTESRQTFNVRYQLNVSLFTVSVYFHDVAEKNKKMLVNTTGVCNLPRRQNYFDNATSSG